MTAGTNLKEKKGGWYVINSVQTKILWNKRYAALFCNITWTERCAWNWYSWKWKISIFNCTWALYNKIFSFRFCNKQNSSLLFGRWNNRRCYKNVLMNIGTKYKSIKHTIVSLCCYHLCWSNWDRKNSNKKVP